MKKFEFKIQGTTYHVSVEPTDHNAVIVEVNGTTYEVETEQVQKIVKTPKLVRKSVVTAPGEGVIKKETGAGGAKIKSPLPGTITKLNVKAGDAVKKGDSFLAMEAMKMINNVLAEKDGVVASVNVKEGQAVLQDDVLIIME